MTITVTNLLQGPADIYVGTVGAVEPTSVATIGVGWTNVGATLGGSKLTVAQDYSTLNVDQTAIDVDARLQKVTHTIDTTLAEPTLANLRIAWNQATSAATSISLDPSATVNASPNFTAVLLAGTRPGGGARLVILRRALSMAGAALEHKKDSQTVLPVTFQAFYVSSVILPIKVDETP